MATENFLTEAQRLDAIENPLVKILAEAELAAETGVAKTTEYLLQTALAGAQGIYEGGSRTADNFFLNPLGFSERQQKKKLTGKTDDEIAQEEIETGREFLRGIPGLGEKITNPEGEIDIGAQLERVRKEYVGEGLERTMGRNPLATLTGAAGSLVPYAALGAIRGVGPVLTGEAFEGGTAKFLGEKLAKRVLGASIVGGVSGGLSEIPYALSDNTKEGRLNHTSFSQQVALGAGAGAAVWATGSLGLKGVDKILAVKQALAKSRKVSADIKTKNIQDAMLRNEEKAAQAEFAIEQQAVSESFSPREFTDPPTQSLDTAPPLEDLSVTSRQVYEDSGLLPPNPEVEQLRLDLDTQRRKVLPVIDSKLKKSANLQQTPQGKELADEMDFLSEQIEQVGRAQDEDLAKTMQIKKRDYDKKKNLLQKGGGTLGEGLDHVLASTGRKLGEIDPALPVAINDPLIKGVMGAVDTKKIIKPELDLHVKVIEKNKKPLGNLVERFEGFTPEQKALYAQQPINEVGRALYLQGDYENLKRLQADLGAPEANPFFEKWRPIGDDLYQKEVASGRKIGYIEGHIPSGVKDYEEYLKWADRYLDSDLSKNIKAEVDAAVAAEKKMLGVDSLSEAQRAQVYNRFLSPETFSGGGTPGNFKARTRGDVGRAGWFEETNGIKRVNLYEDLSSQVSKYIDRGNLDFRVRNFLGKGYKARVTELEKIMQVLKDDPSLKNLQDSVEKMNKIKQELLEYAPKAAEYKKESFLDKALGTKRDPALDNKFSPEEHGTGKKVVSRTNKAVAEEIDNTSDLDALLGTRFTEEDIAKMKDKEFLQQNILVAQKEAKDLAEDVLKRQREDSLEDSLGFLVKDIADRRRKASGIGLDVKEEKYIKEATKAILFTARESPHALTRFFRDLGYQVGLGDFNNAISQLGDLTITMAVDGMQNFLKGTTPQGIARGMKMLKKGGITQVELGMPTEGFTREVLDKTMTVTGMKATDALGKASKMSSSLERLKDMANPSNPKKVKELIAELRPMFLYDDKLVKDTIKKIRTGSLDELSGDSDILAMLINRLSKQQPVLPTSYTLAYLKNPNARLLYAMKNFTISQMNNTYELGFKRIADGVKKGNKKEIGKGLQFLATQMVYMTGGNTARNWLQDRIAGRDDQGVYDAFLDATWANLFISRYNIYRAQDQGLPTAVQEYFMKAPTPLFDYLWSDVMGTIDKYKKGDFDPEQTFNLLEEEKLKSLRDAQLVRAVPVFGQTGYWQLGGGRTKTRKRLAAKLKKQEAKEGKVLTDKEDKLVTEVGEEATTKRKRRSSAKEARDERDLEKLYEKELNKMSGPQNLGELLGKFL